MMREKRSRFAAFGECCCGSCRGQTPHAYCCVACKHRHILSSRIRLSRNLANFEFAALLSRAARRKVEHVIANSVLGLEGDIKGKYFSVVDTTPG